MKSTFLFVFTFLLMSFIFGQETQKNSINNITCPDVDPGNKQTLNIFDAERMRVIITTDLPDLVHANGGDPDDIQSMVRFLLFSRPNLLNERNGVCQNRFSARFKLYQ